MDGCTTYAATRTSKRYRWSHYLRVRIPLSPKSTPQQNPILLDSPVDLLPKKIKKKVCQPRIKYQIQLELRIRGARLRMRRNASSRKSIGQSFPHFHYFSISCRSLLRSFRPLLKRKYCGDEDFTSCGPEARHASTSPAFEKTEGLLPPRKCLRNQRIRLDSGLLQKTEPSCCVFFVTFSIRL